MNQSIEDASIIEDAKAAGFTVFDKPSGLLIGTQGNTPINELLTKFAQLREARQSSQSEPVAEFTDEQLAMFSDNADRYNLTNAAPQQAIPSGWKLVPNTADSAMMNKGAGLLQELQSKMSVTRSLQDICRLVYEVMLEASPTAPIESDKWWKSLLAMYATT
jgi:hypothetical protein